MDPKDLLRHHVTGAIERGETEAIVEQRAKTIHAFDIEAHGVDHAQYFQGAGVMFTDFDESCIGSGENAQEAYENAVEGLAQNGWNVDKLPRSESALRRRGLLKSDSVTAFLKRSGQAADFTDEDEPCELTYYVTIRVR